MSIIKKPVHFEGEKGENTLHTLFENGTTFSCIRPEFVDKLTQSSKLKYPIKINQTDDHTIIEVNERCILDFYLDGIRFSDEFYIVPNLPDDAVIGETTLLKWEIELDFESYKPIVKPKEAKMSFFHSIIWTHKK